MCDVAVTSSALQIVQHYILFAGSLVSIISILNNSILLYSFLTHPRCFTSYFHFLCILSTMDIVISAMYIPVIAVDHWKDTFQSLYFARLWWSYFQVLLSVSNVAMVASSYILTAALLERYLITMRSNMTKNFQRYRSNFCLAAFLMAIISKGPTGIELSLVYNPSCRNTIAEYQVDLAPVCNSVAYGTVYRFWFRNIATVFVPFLLLLIVNTRTIQVLKSQLNKAKAKEGRKFSFSIAGKKKVRAATCTLLLVCITYLLSNLPNVIITVWEFVDFDSLQNANDFYTFSTDLVSILVVISCAMRLPIYLLSNAELRRVTARAICGHSKTTGVFLKNASTLYTLNFQSSILKEKQHRKSRVML